MDFYTGQMVVCINGQFDRTFYHEILPVKGIIYTIRAIETDYMPDQNSVGLLLEEIVNVPHIYEGVPSIGSVELSFKSTRFRPVKHTNIDLLIKICEPNPKEKVLA